MKTPDFKAKDTVFLTISERTYSHDHFLTVIIRALSAH